MRRRRNFITLVGGAGAWPLAARAQQPAMPVIGFLHAGSPEPNAEFVAAFRRGLSEAGFVEGQNVTIEYRWAEGQLNRLPEIAADLVRRHVTVIATPISTPATLAAKAATTTIPIVFGSGADPVALGLVSSFSRPGGNVTGVSIMTAGLAAKRLGVLHDMLPKAVHIGVLGNSHNALSEVTVKDLLTTTPTLGMRAEVLYAGTESELETAFATMAQKHIEAVLIAPDEFFTSRLEQLAEHDGAEIERAVTAFARRSNGGLILTASALAAIHRDLVVSLAARYKLPAVYITRYFVAGGGLVSHRYAARARRTCIALGGSHRN